MVKQEILHHEKVTSTQRIKKGAIYLSVAGVLGLYAASCSSGTQYETVTKMEATKGVLTTLKETSSGEFSIIDEQLLDKKEDSRIIVQYLDGRIDSMNLDQASKLINPQDTTAWASDNQQENPNNNNNSSTHSYHRPHGLGGAIWWGAFGYMMGRNINSPVNNGFYQYRQQSQEERNGSRGVTRTFTNGGKSQADYDNMHNSLRSTSKAVTSSRPISGKSGFFSRFRGSTGG